MTHLTACIHELCLISSVGARFSWIRRTLIDHHITASMEILLSGLIFVQVSWQFVRLLFLIKQSPILD